MTSVELQNTFLHQHGPQCDENSAALKMQNVEATPSGRRLQHIKLAIVVPLTVLGMALGVMLLNKSGDLTPAATDTMALQLALHSVEMPSPATLSVAASAAESTVQDTAAVVKTTNSTQQKPSMKEIMQVRDHIL